MRKGFTLIEILIVISIIIFLSAVLLIGKSSGEKRLALDRMAYQLAQDLRQTQQMAMGAEEFDCGNAVITYNFGIHFKSSWPDYYIIFADCNSNHIRDGADEDIRTVDLEDGVEIFALFPSSSFSVVFEPPDPRIYIGQSAWNREAEITFSFGSNLKKVKINSAGRIEVE